MPFSHLFRKFGQPNLARPVPVDTERARHGRRKTSSTDDYTSLSPTSTPSRNSTVETPTREAGVREVPLAGPSVQNNPFEEPQQERTLASSFTLDNLTEAWNLVKSGPSDSRLNRKLDAFGALWCIRYFCPVIDPGY